MGGLRVFFSFCPFNNTVELQWFEHLWDNESMFETRAVLANEC